MCQTTPCTVNIYTGQKNKSKIGDARWVDLTLLQQVMARTNFSKIVSVSFVPEQHSSLLTGGLGGDNET